MPSPPMQVLSRSHTSTNLLFNCIPALMGHVFMGRTFRPPIHFFRPPAPAEIPVVLTAAGFGRDPSPPPPPPPSASSSPPPLHLFCDPTYLANQRTALKFVIKGPLQVIYAPPPAHGQPRAFSRLPLSPCPCSPTLTISPRPAQPLSSSTSRCACSPPSSPSSPAWAA